MIRSYMNSSGMYWLIYTQKKYFYYSLLMANVTGELRLHLVRKVTLAV